MEVNYRMESWQGKERWIGRMFSFKSWAKSKLCIFGSQWKHVKASPIPHPLSDHPVLNLILFRWQASISHTYFHHISSSKRHTNLYHPNKPIFSGDEQFHHFHSLIQWVVITPTIVLVVSICYTLPETKSSPETRCLEDEPISFCGVAINWPIFQFFLLASREKNRPNPPPPPFHHPPTDPRGRSPGTREASSSWSWEKGPPTARHLCAGPRGPIKPGLGLGVRASDAGAAEPTCAGKRWSWWHEADAKLTAVGEVRKGAKFAQTCVGFGEYHW